MKMNFEPLTHADLDYLKEFEPPGWGDLVPRFIYHIESAFCKPVKLTVFGKTVAIGTTIFHKDSAWLASIIVHPESRNMGYGTAITKFLVDAIDRDTYSTIYLDATEMGYPVYIKLGFMLEMPYAHLKADRPVAERRISDAVIPYSQQYLQELLAIDRFVSAEDRADTITGHLQSAMLYVNGDSLEGFYLPALTNGLVIANNDLAGIELMNYRLQHFNYAVLPEANTTAIHFLLQQNLVQFRISRRMYMGRKRAWHAGNIYNRISGQLG